MYLVTYRRDPDSNATMADEVEERPDALDHAEATSKDVPGWVEVWRLNQAGKRTRLVAQFKAGAMYL